MNSPTGNEVQRFKQLTNDNGAIMRRSPSLFALLQIVFWLRRRLNKHRDAMLLFCNGNCCMCTIDSKRSLEQSQIQNCATNKQTNWHANKQANKTCELTIVPGGGFDAPSLAKHLVTRSMVRCPFARQVCTTMQTYTRNAMQSLNQRPLTNGFTNCKRQANLRGHKHSSNFYSSSMSAQR